MRIAKPMLLVTTPLGVIEGVYECYKLAGGLVFIMLAMLMVMICAAGSVILTIRREGKPIKNTLPINPIRPGEEMPCKLS